ncbi:MAG: hypothetical protein ACT4NX_02075 [Deltaproteobacteria bacterium]
MGFKSLLWILVLAAALYVAFQAGPILYKGTLGIRGVCKEYADQYKKYGREYIYKRITESLDEKGIPADNRDFTVNITEKSVVIEIFYSDTADFFGRYEKTFDFSYECEGELKSVY